jgi:mRNA interferase MazF
MSVKSEINNDGSHPVGYREREVWLCNLGENIGFEEDGKGARFVRPVLIMKIYSRRFCHVVPFSTTERRGRFYYAFDAGTGKVSIALLSQSRPVDSFRLMRKIGVAREKDFEQIRNQVADLLLSRKK